MGKICPMLIAIPGPGKLFGHISKVCGTVTSNKTTHRVFQFLFNIPLTATSNFGLRNKQGDTGYRARSACTPH